MMSKEETIGTLDNAKHFTYGDEKFNDAFDSAINYLKETMWIPVTKRLPEETGWYLCTLRMCFSEDLLVDTFRFETANGNFWSGGIEYNVVAWMPLPKPYEEGAEE